VKKPRYRLRADGRASIMDSWHSKNCGARLREEREAAGLSQADAAALVGVTVAMYGRYERGVSEPSATVLLRLFVAKLDLIYLLGDHRSGGGSAAHAEKAVATPAPAPDPEASDGCNWKARFLAQLEAQDKSILAWCHEQGFEQSTVYRVLRGRTSCRAGTSRGVLIAMGGVPPSRYGATEVVA